MQTFLGWDPNDSIRISSLTVCFYVMAGGLLSAIFNEVLQFFLIWLGCLLIPILGLIETGGWSAMTPEQNAVGMHWFAVIFGWGLAISFGCWTTDFLVVQRVMSAKDVRSAQDGTIIGGFFKMYGPSDRHPPGTPRARRAPLSALPEEQP